MKRTCVFLEGENQAFSSLIWGKYPPKLRIRLSVYVINPFLYASELEQTEYFYYFCKVQFQPFSSGKARKLNKTY